MRNKNARIPNIGSIHTYEGTPLRQILEPRFDGSITKLVSVGEENIQDRIEAEAPYTDINYMLNRLSLGDQSVLSVKRPMYGDFSGMPDNPVDAINMVHLAESRFSSFSSEDKQKYNNDYRVWLASLFSGISGPAVSDVLSADVDDSQLTEQEVKVFES